MEQKLENNKSIYLIDGEYFLRRIYHKIANSDANHQVNLFFEFCVMIKDLINRFDPKYLLLTLDSGEPIIRKEIDSNYKKDKTLPFDVIEQKKLIKEFCDIIGLKHIEAKSIESQDLIASLATKFSKEENKIVIITGEKNLHQILANNITIFDPFKKQILTKEILEQSLGFSIERISFYHSLQNINGIGPILAKKIATQFESLEQLYKKLDLLENKKLKDLLFKSQDSNLINYRLLNLILKEIKLDKDTVTFDQKNWIKAYPLFKSLKLFRLIHEKENIMPIAQSVLSNKYNFVCIDKIEDLRQLCSAIRQMEVLAIDTESSGLDPWTSKLVGISICIQEGLAFYIPFGHKTELAQLTPKQVYKELKPILEDPNIAKILQYAQYDSIVLHNWGINLEGIVFDTLIAADLLQSKTERIGLKYLSKKYFDEPMLSFEDVVKKNGYRNFSHVPLNLATIYAAADAHQTFKLYKLFKQQLKDKNLLDIFNQIEIPFLNLLINVEKSGVLIDRIVFEKINIKILNDLQNKFDEIDQELNTLGLKVNINSHKQVEKLLFIQLNLVPSTLTATGAYSTNSSVLTNLAQQHKIPGLLAEYRELTTLKNFMQNLINLINPKTGLIHCSYNQIQRYKPDFIKEAPSLQNIPVNKYNIRSIIKPLDEYMHVRFDLSALECNHKIIKEIAVTVNKEILDKQLDARIILLSNKEILLQTHKIYHDQILDLKNNVINKFFDLNIRDNSFELAV